ncbi:MAG: type II toxin-antitoxin system MqsA family antitoxin [Thiocapsa sp.]|uniref:type II toxin-antitoxin system MqsA family antitoxin n=1 Tax=Thiocapsa sp. TaxID=2024551 RepID=UPI001BCDD0C3|nr:type II toxin-antitoxin system MqsA family antitoxin [Thiocapsa sp.]QVL47961.1 MAG: type II toxin-antitoxin system MqsA family antitoxin [Thiocapsa sp.]
MTQQCSFCGHAHLIEKRTRYIHQIGDEILIVEDVPCLECEYCGEQYFAIDILKKIEADHLAVADHRKQPSRILQVAVEDFQSL